MNNRLFIGYVLALCVIACGGVMLNKPDPSHPGQTVVVPATPGTVAADLGKCFLGAETSDPSLVKWLGSLFSRPDGATIAGTLLAGPGAQLFGCGMAELATLGTQDTAAVSTDKGYLISQRADQCLSGPCERVELKAARLLRDMSKSVNGKPALVKLPPSGQG